MWQRVTMLCLAAMAFASGTKADVVPLKRAGGAYLVPAEVDETITLAFLLDSGASVVLVPESAFLALKQAGKVSDADVLESRAYQLADGSDKQLTRFVIHSLKVGGMELRNIVAAVTPGSGQPLLGQTFLSRFRSWSIDNDRHELLLDEQPRDQSAPIKQHGGAPPDEAGWELLGRSMMLGPEVPGPWLYIDTTRITIKGNIRRAWFKEIPAGRRPKDPHRAEKYELTLVEFDCEDRTTRDAMRVTEHLDGTRDTFDDSKYPGLWKWEPVVPDSLGEARLVSACSWSPP